MTLGFIKNNPFPDLDNFVQMVYRVCKKSDSVVAIGSYVYRKLKKVYENVLDEHIVRECSKYLYSKDGMREMLRCHNLLGELIQYNYDNNDIEQYDRFIMTSLPRLVEHYWDGIGEWLA